MAWLTLSAQIVHLATSDMGQRKCSTSGLLVAKSLRQITSVARLHPWSGNRCRVRVVETGQAAGTESTKSQSGEYFLVLIDARCEAARLYRTNWSNSAVTLV